MHLAVWRFFERAIGMFPHAFRAKRVLEAGSMDVNGSAREFFRVIGKLDGQEYIGIDWREGSGVDAVSLIHEYREKPDGYFGTVVSTSTLEHDPYWKESLRRMVELLSDGGCLMITVPGFGRGSHCEEGSPVAGYYRNLKATEILGAILEHAAFGKMWVENLPGDVFMIFDGKRRG